MVIGSIIHINIMLKPIAKFVVIGYLILTVGVASVPIGISFYKNNEEKKEVSTDKEIVKEESKSNNPMSILIKLTGKEKETTRGMYLPTENGKAIYIPKQLYNKTNNEMQLLTQRHSQANMSEYLLDTENHVKKWLSQLTIDDFYNKYMKMYKLKMDKEVMV